MASFTSRGRIVYVGCSFVSQDGGSSLVAVCKTCRSSLSMSSALVRRTLRSLSTSFFHRRFAASRFGMLPVLRVDRYAPLRGAARYSAERPRSRAGSGPVPHRDGHGCVRTVRHHRDVARVSAGRAGQHGLPFLEHDHLVAFLLLRIAGRRYLRLADLPELPVHARDVPRLVPLDRSLFVDPPLPPPGVRIQLVRTVALLVPS